jgi:hypothetical protein
VPSGVKMELGPWLMTFVTILDSEAPNELSSFTEDKDAICQRDRSNYWRIKAIAAKIT